MSKCPFLSSPCKNFTVTQFYSICAHFSHAPCVLKLNLPHHDGFGLGVSACYGNHPPPKSLFLRVCAPQTFCVHFSHVSYNLHLISTHTRSSSLRVFLVAMVTNPPKLMGTNHFLQSIQQTEKNTYKKLHKNIRSPTDYKSHDISILQINEIIF